MRIQATLVFVLAAVSCQASDDDRRAIEQESQRVNIAVARDSVVRDLRSPSDTAGRLIYQPPTNLAKQHAPSAGAARVWAPFGIATPDTLHSTATSQ